MKKCKGVILAGGSGTRLYPLTKVTNKTLLPVGKEPMIMHMLEIFQLSGIDDVMIVSNSEHMDHVVRLLGSGKSHGFSITYRIQDEANGIAAALSLCKDFAASSKLAVILGDNIFENVHEVANPIHKFMNNNDDYHLLVKEVNDPTRFGVAVYDDFGSVKDIVEKPKNPPSNDAVVGVYMYTPEVFDVIDRLTPSKRGEYEISDVNSYFVKKRKGSLTKITCDWIDAGTHESYRLANEMMWRKSI